MQHWPAPVHSSAEQMKDATSQEPTLRFGGLTRLLPPNLGACSAILGFVALSRSETLHPLLYLAFTFYDTQPATLPCECLALDAGQSKKHARCLAADRERWGAIQAQEQPVGCIDGGLQGSLLRCNAHLCGRETKRNGTRNACLLCTARVYYSGSKSGLTRHITSHSSSVHPIVLSRLGTQGFFHSEHVATMVSGTSLSFVQPY